MKPDQLPNDWDCTFDADGTRVLLGPRANVGAAGLDLSGADLSGADLTGATLDGATLVGVTWDNTTCPSGVNSDDNGNSCP